MTCARADGTRVCALQGAVAKQRSSLRPRDAAAATTSGAAQAPAAKEVKVAGRSMSALLQSRSEAAAADRRAAAAEPASPMPDIDRADAADPLQASEYVGDIFTYYRRVEPQFRVSPDYMLQQVRARGSAAGSAGLSAWAPRAALMRPDAQTDINDKMRAILVDWLVEVHLKFKVRAPVQLAVCSALMVRPARPPARAGAAVCCSVQQDRIPGLSRAACWAQLMPETLFLTTNLIDRFLELKPVTRKNLQLARGALRPSRQPPTPACRDACRAQTARPVHAGQAPCNAGHFLFFIFRPFEHRKEGCLAACMQRGALLRAACLRARAQVGVTAMLIASKYEEIWAPEVRDFVYISDRAYTRDQILAMEKLMLNTLRFNLTVPTPFNFLARFLKAAGTHAKPEARATPSAAPGRRPGSPGPSAAAEGRRMDIW